MSYLNGNRLLYSLASLMVSGCSPSKTPSPANPGDRKPTQVIAVQAWTEPVADTLSLIGTVTADEMVRLQSESAGIVETIHFEEGQKVTQGQLLLELNQDKWQAAVVEAEANLALSQSTHQRDQRLLEDKLISAQAFDQSRTRFEAQKALVDLRRHQLDDTRITAPFSGTVGARYVSPGQVIGPETALTWLVSLDPCKLEFNVPERFLSVCEKGQKIEVMVAAYPDQRFTGMVYFVAPFVEPELRTTLVKARLPNPAGLLKPGMFATLELTLTIREEAIVIPESAIFRALDNERATVYVVDNENLAQLRTVKVGERQARKVEILEGLKEGEKIIVEGNQKIGPGAPVHPVPPANSTEERR
jgi:membrane fusion protein, multidrug efflux system